MYRLYRSENSRPLSPNAYNFYFSPFNALNTPNKWGQIRGMLVSSNLPLGPFCDESGILRQTRHFLTISTVEIRHHPQKIWPK